LYLPRYVVSIESPEERELYLRDMLDPESSNTFFDELKKREGARSGVAYRKPQLNDSDIGVKSKDSRGSTIIR